VKTLLFRLSGRALLSDGPRLSTACSSYNSSTKIKVSTAHWWNYMRVPHHSPQIPHTDWPGDVQWNKNFNAHMSWWSDHLEQCLPKSPRLHLVLLTSVTELHSAFLKTCNSWSPTTKISLVNSSDTVYNRLFDSLIYDCKLHVPIKRIINGMLRPSQYQGPHSGSQLSRETLWFISLTRCSWVNADTTMMKAKDARYNPQERQIQSSRTSMDPQAKKSTHKTQWTTTAVTMKLSARIRRHKSINLI